MAAYRHFKNKEALLAALAAEGLHAFAGSLRSASRAADPRTRLFDVCKAYLRFSRDHRADFELIFGAAIGNRKRYPELYEAGGEAFAVLTGVVADCQKAKVLDARRDTIACAANLWVHIHGLCSLSPNWRTSDRIRAPKKPDALVETFMGDLLDGLGGHAR